MTVKVGSVVKLWGKTLATVTSVHKGGKRLGVSYLDGTTAKSTFVNGKCVALVTA